MVTLDSSATVWIRHILACMGGCFGCYSKPTPIIAVDEPAKGLRIQGQAVKQPSFSDGFWSSSTFDLDNSTLQSQRSYSSISTSALNLGSTIGSMTSEPEFVNHGLNLWNESRLQWIGSGRSRSQVKQKRARALSWNSTYESVLTRKTPFPRPVPLSEMIEFLVEAWDQDGMYD
ncbi:uncharacterized protein LOC116200239 [Punica granatum]|uniref:Uncharacterized protein LOC116200239 n=1 Tax=Punica granatum TaxID=22663 RepID=A0A6P8CXY1_PUNGR|nr:uncharacterized protein LOC116200239 [Punica granatum]